MKLTLRKGLIYALMVIMFTCFAFGLAACDSCDDEEDPVTSVTHNFSEDWSYDNVAHWHACLDDDCDEVSGYEEHTPTDEGTASGSYVYYTCSVCGADYRSDKYTYIVYVKNIGNAGVSGVKVTMYGSDGTELSTEQSSTSGTVYFRDLEAGNYTAQIDTSSLPVGYSYEESSSTLELTASDRTGTFYLTPHLITEAEMPSGTTYSLGSVVYDFEYTSYYSDGTTGTVKLSDYLSRYKAVVIQFFYTTCDPCKAEFPYMNQSYNDSSNKYYEDIGVIEFAYTGYDYLAYFQDFITGSYGYDNFTYVYDTANYHTNYSVYEYPTTIVVDCYGVVAQVDVGANPTLSYWNTLFAKYSADDYTPSYTTASSGSTEEDTSLLKPDVDMPESGEIAQAIVTENDLTSIKGNGEGDTGTFEFSAYYEDGELDEYSWPWLISDGTEVKGVDKYIYTSNSNKLGTYAILVIDVKLEAGQTFMFDYLLSTEADNDYFYVQVNTIRNKNVIDSCLEAKLSGISSKWETFYYPAQYDGYYQITLTYSKNTSVDEEGDIVYVSNMCLKNTSDAIKDTTEVANADILYNAATYYTLSDTTGSTQYDYYPGVGYANYVSVYLASDGYYHVNYNNSIAKTDGADPDADDPYLLADLMYATAWNSDFSIWNIAYAYLYTTDEDYSTGVASETYSLASGDSDSYTVPANSYYTFTAGSGSVITLSSENTDSVLINAKTLSGESLTCTIYLETGDVVKIESSADGSTVAISTSGKGYLYDQLAVLSALGQEASSDAQAIEDYSWVQTNCDWGYVPVDSTLAEILKEVTYSYGTDSQRSNSNQWLEVCRYYIHYGASHDDCASLDNLAAGYGIRMAVSTVSVNSTNTEGNEETFHANVAKAVLPRGFYYSIEVETEGVYLIYTDVDYNTADGTNTSGTTGTNPYLWITDKYGYGITENDNYDLNVYTKDGQINTDEDETAYYNDNSYMYAYLEAGTYLIGCAMSYSEDTGEYDVYIRYLGSKYSMFAPAATGDIYTYSYDEATETYTYYIPGTYENIRTNDDKTYSVQNANGEWTALYINMTGITYLNSSYKSYTIEQELSRGDDCYWTGDDYITMRNYLKQAQDNTDTAEDGTSLTGYVRADTTIVALLNEYINGGTASTVSDYSDNAWIMTAYYVRVLDAYRVDTVRVIDSE